MNATTARTLTDAQLEAAYTAACNASARHYANGDIDSMFAADRVADVALAEIETRWSSGEGPHLSI